MSKKDVVSKILLCESGNADINATLKTFFQAHGLIALQTASDKVFDLLGSNTDLGGVFISEDSVY